jgi:hypothetical protein
MDPIFAIFEVIKNVYIPCFSMKFDHMLILNYSRVSALYIHNLAPYVATFNQHTNIYE